MIFDGVMCVFWRSKFGNGNTRIGAWCLGIGVCNFGELDLWFGVALALVFFYEL